MALVSEILRSTAKDLTVESYGGSDVGLLCAGGKVENRVCSFVLVDSIPLEPHFRNVRHAGSFEAAELDEGMLQWEFDAAERDNGEFLGPDAYSDDVFCMTAKRPCVELPASFRPCLTE
jgi:acyl CoA:acetate/3-ketoacid CoA transferase alpha subunit